VADFESGALVCFYSGVDTLWRFKCRWGRRPQHHSRPPTKYTAYWFAQIQFSGRTRCVSAVADCAKTKSRRS